MRLRRHYSVLDVTLNIQEIYICKCSIKKVVFAYQATQWKMAQGGPGA